MMELLHRLCAAWGPAGREQKVAGLLEELIGPYAGAIEKDRLGNLLATRRGGGSGGKRVMLCAHMDTIGAIALDVSQQGLVHLAPVGSLKPHNALGSRVVWGSGAVGVLQGEEEENPKELDFAKLWCDIGAASREEALENVRQGDMCVFTGELQQMGDLVTGPGLDNRAGCAVLLEVAQHLATSEHEVVFVFATQGEIGPRGAGTAAYGIGPDLAFVVDVTGSSDVPGGSRTQVRLGKGPALKLKDGNYMAHHELAGLVQQAADSYSIPLQTEILPSPGGHTDAQVVSVAGRGVPAAVIGIPARYRGTANEMVSLRDLHGTADLLLKLLDGPLS